MSLAIRSKKPSNSIPMPPSCSMAMARSVEMTAMDRLVAKTGLTPDEIRKRLAFDFPLVDSTSNKRQQFKIRKRSSR